MKSSRQVRGSACAIVMLGALLGGCSSRPIVYDQKLREATFETYLGALVESYPDATARGLDTAAFDATWRQAVVDAKSITEYYHALARMCCEVGDPHLELVPNYELWERLDGPLGVSDLAVQKLHGRTSLWNFGQDAGARWGIPTPSERSMNGWTVESFNGGALTSSTMHHALNVGPKDSILIVALQSPDETEHAQLPRKRGIGVEVEGRDQLKVPFGTSVASKFSAANLQFRGERELEAAMVDSNVGTYISAWKIGTVGVLVWDVFKPLPHEREDLEVLDADLDAAADMLQGTACALIDLRCQRGGSYAGFAMMMERLLPAGVTMTVAKKDSVLFGLVEVSKVGRISESSSIVNPDGRVVILINEFTASYGEWMASLLRRELSAVTLGARTSGSEYCVIDVEGPDGSRLRFGGAPFQRFDDIPAFQGVGIAPDIAVAAEASDWPAGSMEDTLAEIHRRQWDAAWDIVSACGR